MADEERRLRSGVRQRAPIRVMLVRIEPSCEPPELAQLALEILRVRHPLPACARIRATRPELVLVGENVRDDDFVKLEEASALVGAELFPITGYRAVTFGAWLPGALRRALERRGEASVGT